MIMKEKPSVHCCFIAGNAIGSSDKESDNDMVILRGLAAAVGSPRYSSIFLPAYVCTLGKVAKGSLQFTVYMLK